MAMISVQLPDELHVRLVEAVAGDQMSLNAALVEAAEAWLEHAERRAVSRKLLQEALSDDPELRALLGDD
ncbi:hypothetical protein [Nocardia huaxiensis]|uniref:Toxin-antitoxin system HicB family antitoxin n=1 Tax=Nocardia huaxiensis TaxID=2755382 RepID=A0A7D6ZQF5_9NOCA|nr:hypothetical protein [Nocardia huaxiensis]QLY32823.1 hypothetical protein H0264_11735 [Nocardia huaxiensis]UFS93432.1 hypothetical protein LPY97_21640 [Nocardia huaxiensis]